MKRLIASSLGLLLLGSVLVMGTADARGKFETGQENKSNISNKNTSTRNNENSNQNKTTKKKPGRS